MNRMNGEFTVPSIIHLYNGTDPLEVNVDNLVAFLREHFPHSIINIREDFFRYWFQRCEKKEKKAMMIARRLAQARVRQPHKRQLNHDPLPGEISFERKFLAAGSGKPTGILYDGHKLIAIYSDMFTPDEVSLEYCHIFLTNQLFGTWDKNDCRYHVRVSLYGFPSFISTRGIVEGPARPREYYLGRRLGAGQADLEEAFHEQYIGHGDSRLQEVIKGYLLQVLFYHITGDPFCNDNECRLFNAHWQEEMIHAQMRPGTGLCT
ncbi:MAG: DUF6775 family putative metallopeptidase, partial [Pseudomonadota bacterium]